MKKPIQINLGCGISLVKDFINVDKFMDKDKLKAGLYGGINSLTGEELVVDSSCKFVQADMCELPFKDNYADYIESVDAVEHLPCHRVLLAFKEMYRVLKPGGKLVIITTDFDNLAKLWVKVIAGKPFDEKTIDNFTNLMEVIYGNQQHEGEYHTVPMNPHFLGYLLMHAGFEHKKIDMRIFPMGGPVPGRKFQKTLKILKGGSARTDVLWARATK